MISRVLLLNTFRKYNNNSTAINHFQLCYYLFRQHLQLQVLAAIASDSSTVIRETLSQLEWTPEMIEAFDQNLYFSGNQTDFCFNRDGLVSWYNSCW